MWQVKNRNNKVVGTATTSDGLCSMLLEFRRTSKGYEDNFEDDYAVYPSVFGSNRATIILDKLLSWNKEMQALIGKVGSI